uniref:G-protein coupled receptors family 1 profile domain-containing protein n=1 Tax=Branchiostoma floridae TaxID=7739 RepID=C3ZP51_BRAFL|eukprot:XP_002589667.1 hypothetical protein BRAFLDRAFT_64031 [Branchiostoma floridae]
MFNNSSTLLGKTSSAEKFDKQLSCFLWYLRNQTVPHDQIQDLCSNYPSLLEMGTAANVIWCVMGILIIIPNTLVLGTVVGRKELHKPIYLFMANLAVSDILAGVTLPCSVAIRLESLGLSRLYKVMNVTSFIIYSQMVSASALSLLSIYSYVAVRHPVYFHNQAGNAKCYSGIAIVSSWSILSFFAFSSSMGWNCLDMADPACVHFYPPALIGIIAAIIISMVGIMMFTNISTFQAIRQRQKIRIGQGLVMQQLSNTPGQNTARVSQQHNIAQEEAELKYQKSVHKAGTVVIQVVLALIFWILPLVFIAICLIDIKKCPLQNGPNEMAILWTLNSLINPIAGIVRTPELRKGVRQNCAAVCRAVVTAVQGNDVETQNENPVPGNSANLQEGSVHGHRQ